MAALAATASMMAWNRRRGSDHAQDIAGGRLLLVGLGKLADERRLALAQPGDLVLVGRA